MPIQWGIHKENGFWLSGVRKYRIMFRDHDSLYVAIHRVRFRLMKPSANRTARSNRKSLGKGNR